jgi:predicted metal-dependent phosphoesterase TrpH
MVVADLHVHTTNSDGSMTLDEVLAAAHAADVETVAVTDHDRPHPDIGAPVVERDGVTLVHGIELRVTAGDQRIDLLGHGLRRTADLEAVVDRVQSDRVERGRAIIECVEDRLGVDLDVELGEGIGRPHIARAIGDHSDTDLDSRGAFDELIGSGDPCYVARDIPSFETGAAVLRTACGLVGLAHPLRYGDPEAALEFAAELDAVERYYPYGREVDRGPVERAIADHDLVVTGGSDAHDDVLGKTGLDHDEYRRFREQL